MKKLDILVKKFEEEGKDFPGAAYIHSNECPKDYGMKNAEECDKGNHKYSCKKCWEKDIKY